VFVKTGFGWLPYGVYMLSFKKNRLTATEDSSH